jgi:hypothetical protein
MKAIPPKSQDATTGRPASLFPLSSEGLLPEDCRQNRFRHWQSARRREVAAPIELRRRLKTPSSDSAGFCACEGRESVRSRSGGGTAAADAGWGRVGGPPLRRCVSALAGASVAKAGKLSLRSWPGGRRVWVSCAPPGDVKGNRSAASGRRYGSSLPAGSGPCGPCKAGLP